MDITRSRYLAIASFSLAAALAVQSTSAAGSAGTLRPAHAATALQAVKMELRPYDPRNLGKYNFSNCTKLSPRLHPQFACPETPRLLHYLSVRRLPRFDSGLPFCRCQSAPYSVRVVAVRYDNGRVARVDVLWDFGPTRSSPSQRFHSTKTTDTFVVVRAGRFWLIDDEYCAGRPATSVYKGVAGQRACYSP